MTEDFRAEYNSGDKKAWRDYEYTDNYNGCYHYDSNIREEWVERLLSALEEKDEVLMEYVKDHDLYVKEVRELKSQLEEKDKEIDVIQRSRKAEMEVLKDYEQKNNDLIQMIQVHRNEIERLKSLVPHDSDNICATCEYHGRDALKLKMEIDRLRAENDALRVVIADSYSSEDVEGMMKEKDKEIFDIQGHIDCFKSERDFQVNRCQEKDKEIERLRKDITLQASVLSDHGKLLKERLERIVNLLNEYAELKDWFDRVRVQQDEDLKVLKRLKVENERLKNRGGNLQYDNDDLIEEIGFLRKDLENSHTAEEMDDLIELLKDVVNQACWVMDPASREWYLNPGYIRGDTMALSAYEDAIKWLVENGHAVWIKKGYTARWKE